MLTYSLLISFVYCSAVLLFKFIYRDGEHHHITILNKQELSIVQENENNKGETEAKGDIVGRVFEVLWQHATDDWVDLGLGSASKGEDSSYFKVPLLSPSFHEDHD